MDAACIPIIGQMTTTCDVSPEALAAAVKIAALRVADYSETFDDQGNGWMTYHCQKTGRSWTFLVEEDAPVSADRRVAQLIDAMNVLLYGSSLHITDDDCEARLEAHRSAMRALYDGVAE